MSSEIRRNLPAPEARQTDAKILPFRAANDFCAVVAPGANCRSAQLNGKGYPGRGAGLPL